MKFRMLHQSQHHFWIVLFQFNWIKEKCLKNNRICACVMPQHCLPKGVNWKIIERGKRLWKRNLMTGNLQLISLSIFSINDDFILWEERFNNDVWTTSKTAGCSSSFKLFFCRDGKKLINLKVFNNSKWNEDKKHN